jgi:hypothetical protein
MKTRHATTLVVASLLALTALPPPARAQTATNRQPPTPLVSPEISADRHLTFRIFAPDARDIRLSCGDPLGEGTGCLNEFVPQLFQ